jgi:hypothetical protein
MKNRIAIDINNNPFVDTYANLTHDQALAIIHKDFGKTRLYIEESKKFLTNRNYRTYSMDSEAFKDSIRNAIEITIGKLEIPKDILTELMDIYLLLRTYTSNAEDIVKNASSFENFIKTIEGYWETYLERNKIHKVGNMRIHVLNPKLKATDLKFFLKAFENVQNKTTSTGIPHFSAALYGDFFIVSPHDLSSLAQYSPNRDVISINSINISYGLTHVEQSIIHELCHRYYRKVLNKKEKEEWLDFFFRTQKSTLSREKPKIGDSLFFKYGLSINKPRPYRRGGCRALCSVLLRWY